jgi:hypothetical protein
MKTLIMTLLLAMSSGVAAHGALAQAGPGTPAAKENGVGNGNDWELALSELMQGGARTSLVERLEKAWMEGVEATPTQVVDPRGWRGYVAIPAVGKAEGAYFGAVFHGAGSTLKVPLGEPMTRYGYAWHTLGVDSLGAISNDTLAKAALYWNADSLKIDFNNPDLDFATGTAVARRFYGIQDGQNGTPTEITFKSYQKMLIGRISIPGAKSCDGRAVTLSSVTFDGALGFRGGRVNTYTIASASEACGWIIFYPGPN